MRDLIQSDEQPRHLRAVSLSLAALILVCLSVLVPFKSYFMDGQQGFANKLEHCVGGTYNASVTALKSAADNDGLPESAWQPHLGLMHRQVDLLSLAEPLAFSIVRESRTFPQSPRFLAPALRAPPQV